MLATVSVSTPSRKGGPGANTFLNWHSTPKAAKQIFCDSLQSLQSVTAVTHRRPATMSQNHCPGAGRGAVHPYDCIHRCLVDRLLGTQAATSFPLSLISRSHGTDRRTPYLTCSITYNPGVETISGGGPYILQRGYKGPVPTCCVCSMPVSNLPKYTNDTGRRGKAPSHFPTGGGTAACRPRGL